MGEGQRPSLILIMTGRFEATETLRWFQSVLCYGQKGGDKHACKARKEEV